MCTKCSLKDYHERYGVFLAKSGARPVALRQGWLLFKALGMGPKIVTYEAHRSQ